MKIVVIGGTGLIGSKTVAILRQGGHEVVAASPKSGINSITGEGLKEAMVGAQAVIDLANSPSFEDKAGLEFFENSRHHLLPAEAPAGLRPRGPILRRPGRGALARAVGRGAPRPHRFGRMAPPLTGRSLIPIRQPKGRAP